ncbi:Calcium uniporter protein [Balamuthia mandrillaris]
MMFKSTAARAPSFASPAPLLASAAARRFASTSAFNKHAFLVARPTAFAASAGPTFQRRSRFSSSFSSCFSNPILSSAQHFSTQSSNESEVQPVLAELLQKAQYRQIANELEQDSRVKLPLSDYHALCKKHGLSEREANELLSALHKTGRFLHYAHSRELSSFVILKPEELTRTFAKLLDTQGQFSQAFVQQTQKELEELEQQLQPMNEQVQELQRKAKKRADFWMGTSMAWLVLQGALVARLTWWELSWDIMEPITYMITFTTITGGLAYFIATKTEYTYEALRETLTRRRLEKLTRRHGFDQDRFNKLQQQIEEKRQALKAPELSLLHPPAQQ